MINKTGITCLFVDIGGVLLTDGWSHKYRKLASKKFNLNAEEMEKRHNQAFDTCELDKLTLNDYLNQVVFYEKRPFTKAQFRKFIFSQSKPYPNVINLVRNLKEKYGLKIVALSNEAREINAYRIRKFKLTEFVDFFISSCFVHLRKPDPDIFRLALDITQASVHEAIYIENTSMFVKVAESMGIRSILHTDYNSTIMKLARYGLE